MGRAPARGRSSTSCACSCARAPGKTSSRPPTRTTKVRYWSTFGAYMAGVGVNAIVPARGGDVVKLYIARHRIEHSSYPTLASSLVVETLFDFVVASRALPGRDPAGTAPGSARPAAAARVRLDVRRRAPPDRRVHLVHPPRRADRPGRLGLAPRHRLQAEARSRLRHPARLARLRAGGRLLAGRELDRAGRSRRSSSCAPSTSTRPRRRRWPCSSSRPLDDAPVHARGAPGTQQAILVFALAGAAASSTILAFSFGQQLVVTIVNVAIGFGAILLMLGTLRWRQPGTAAPRRR